MKQVLKITIAIFAIASVAVFTACNNSGDKRPPQQIQQKQKWRMKAATIFTPVPCTRK